MGMRIFHRLAIGLAFTSACMTADTLSTMPGLQNVWVTEVSGGVSTDRPLTFFAMVRWTFLTPVLRDFTTSSGELYDVYFSDANGAANYSGGEYVSISALYTGPDAGLNIDRVWLRFNNGRPDLYANVVTSFNPGVANYVSNSENFAVDGVNGTYSEMGQSGGGQRLRITVGFPAPTPVPEPSAFAATTLGALSIAALAKGRRLLR